MKKDDMDFIDLDSTMNWSQLDVERELDNREFDESTGKRLDYAKGFGDDGKKDEMDVLLDGLTSGLNYIPKEFLMAAQEKKDGELEAIPEEQKPDVSWAYREETDEDDDDEPFIAIADIKRAEEEERQRRAKEVQMEVEKELELQKVREENHEALVAKVNKNAENDASIQANIEARKHAREEAQQVAANIAKANAEAIKAKEEEAREAMFAEDKALDEFLLAPDDVYQGPTMTKEERIAAANKNRHNVTAPIESEKVVEAEEAGQFSADDSEQYEEDVVTEVINEEVSGEKRLSTGDTGVVYYDTETFEEIDNTPKEYEEVVVKVKKKKKESSAADEYMAWLEEDEEKTPVKKKKPSNNDKSGKKPPKGGSGKKSSKKKKKKNKHAQDTSFLGRIFNFFESLSAIDYAVAATGILVIVAAIITGLVYSNSKVVNAQIAEFAPLGRDMEKIGVTGSGKLVAVADAKRLLATMEEEEEEEEKEVVTEYEEKEDENEGKISVTMSLTSVKKDLKIKFINAKTKKLVGNYAFEVDIETADGKKRLEKDADKDGIIYLKDVAPGKAKVSMRELADEKNLLFSTEQVSVTIKENIEYKKIDVADEVKDESQVNAAKEDTQQKTATESVLKDTVEWVESTQTAKNGTLAKYITVDASKIDNLPKDSAKARWNSLKASVAEAWCMKVLAVCDEDKHVGGELVDKVDPTCKTGGYEKRICEVCTTEYEIVIKADPTKHSWNNDGVCSECGEKKEGSENETKCQEHVWDSGAITTKPKCTEEGVKTFKCTNPNCTETKTEKIEPLGHKYESGKCVNEGCTATKGDENTELTCNGEKVYVDEKGSRVATFADYYANPNMKFYIKNPEASKEGEYIYTGWQEIGGNTYFFDKSGNKVTGEQVIQGAKYNFDSQGALIKGSGTLGIDVSKWNGSINWQAVKNSGISYVIIRCGYRGSSSGALIEDPKFKSNIKGARDAGLKVGVYFYSQATSDVEAVEEASMTLDLIKGYGIAYPVFLDVEGSGGRGDRIDAATRTAVINAYCQTIKNGGYTPGLYANKNWLETKINTGSLTGCKIWLAQYNATPTYKGHYDMWQYSDNGSVGGIGGKTDMNLSYLGY